MTAIWDTVFEWDNERWRDHAACRDTDSSLFFPSGSTGWAAHQIQAAKVVCRSCPVQDACLRFAFETNQEAGVWGGKDEEERRRSRQIWRAGNLRAARSAVM